MNETTPLYDIAYDPDPTNPNPHPWQLWGNAMRDDRNGEEVAELFRLEWAGVPEQTPPFVVVEKSELTVEFYPREAGPEMGFAVDIPNGDPENKWETLAYFATREEAPGVRP